MTTENKMQGVGGWEVPSAPFDYRQMEQEAQRECDVLKARLTELKAREPRDADTDFLLRREICMLTDIYYEQRHLVRLFGRRAAEREAKRSAVN